MGGDVWRLSDIHSRKNLFPTIVTEAQSECSNAYRSTFMSSLLFLVNALNMQELALVLKKSGDISVE